MQEKSCGSFGVFLQAWLLCRLSPAGCERLLFGIAAKSANRFGHLTNTAHICAIIRSADFYVS